MAQTQPDEPGNDRPTNSQKKTFPGRPNTTAELYIYAVVIAKAINVIIPGCPLSHTVSLDPAIPRGTLIRCTDCHNNDAGPRAGGSGPDGPHGSAYDFLLDTFICERHRGNNGFDDDHYPFDEYLNNHLSMQMPAYGSTRLLISQRPCYSDISGQETDYRPVINSSIRSKASSARDPACSAAA